MRCATRSRSAEEPSGLALTLDCTKLYVGTSDKSSVSVISTASRKVIATIPVGLYPSNLVITPDGTKLFTANSGSIDLSVIDTVHDTAVASIKVANLARANLAHPTITPDGRKSISPCSRPTPSRS